MSDERIVEVIAESLYGDPALFHDSDPMTKTALRKQARGILGDLRAAGFDVYRPDECALLEYWRDGWSLTTTTSRIFGASIPHGTYRLVPVKEGADA